MDNSNQTILLNNRRFISLIHPVFHMPSEDLPIAVPVISDGGSQALLDDWPLTFSPISHREFHVSLSAISRLDFKLSFSTATLPKMPPDPTIDEDEEYASSEDSDFAPDAAGDQASEQSADEDEVEKPKTKRDRSDGNDDAGYDNSGDEAIIEKGKKRRKRAKAKGESFDDEEGGEGGLIKTRRQRAAE